MSYRGGRYSGGNRRGNNNNFRNSGRRDGGNSGFRDRSGGRSRDFDSRRRVGDDDRRRDDFKRFDDRQRRDSFGSNSNRGMKRKFRDQSPRRRSNDFKFGRDNSKDFRRRGLDRPNRGGSDRRFGSRQSNDRSSSSNRHRSTSGNSDRVKMPPPKGPRNLQRRGGIEPRSLGGGGIRRDTKKSLIHKRLAEKHARRDRTREVINKRIKMAKMRSTLNQRKRTTKLGTRLTTFKKATGKIGTGASKVAKNKKQSESADKDTADEMWDEDEKQIHEEEMAAKKAAEALHESNSGDDATKKGEKTAVKIKRERTESASEQDTQSKSTKSDLQKRVPNSSLNLTCVHCKSKCQTSMEYKVHLDGRGHRAAMSKISAKQKQQLQRMRQEQRDAQKEADEGVEKDARSKHCQLCRLFYKQTKEEHQQSEDHKNIKKFLMPYCHVCKISYKSPMAYETHRSSMHHLRSKARYERAGKIPEVEETELDLDNFTTVDEVGEIDGDDENDVGSETHAEDQNDHQDFSDEEPCDINVGSEHIKQVQVHYCELCSMYIRHHGDQDKSLSRHCILRSHLRNYIRYKDDKALQAEAEALHKKRKAERELKEKEKAAAAEKATKENGDANHTKEDETMKDSNETSDEKKNLTAAIEDATATESVHTENGDLLDISIKKEKDDSFFIQEEDEGVAA